jgi:hypothetical protein
MRRTMFLRRATIWLATIGYALVASGLPLPVGLPAPGGDVVTDTRLAAKDRSRPFPCMDKPCGCATAEQCFANCCCHTPAERLAWAKAHRVEPSVLAALERRVAADSAPADTTGGCCATNAKRKPSCCSADVCAEPEADPSPAPPRVRSVTLKAMLACGGIVTQWLSVGGSLPPPRLDLVLDQPLVDRCPLGDCDASLLASPPDAPPPRAA